MAFRRFISMFEQLNIKKRRERTVLVSTVLSATMQGLRAEMVHIEADVSNGLPMFHLVGYLSSEVK